MPTLSHVQRLTYSSYYSGNCGKGGVGLQFCGYIITIPLWTGGVSDSDYLTPKINKDGEEDGVLVWQKKFQDEDLVNGEVKEFVNMLDKGFRIVQPAIKYKQKIIQPIFASSERDFC